MHAQSWQRSLPRRTPDEQQQHFGCPKKPPIPPSYLPRARPPSEPIYSVVAKARGVEISASGRRKELEHWLRNNNAEPTMFQEEHHRRDSWRRELEEDDPPRYVPAPRGIVGLVGPYRVSQGEGSASHQQHQQQYGLEPEEMVDSVSEAPSTLGRRHWRNQQNLSQLQDQDDQEQEDDDETIIPEDKPNHQQFTEPQRKESTGGSGSNWKLAPGTVRYGREERAVDVPDGASGVSCDKAKLASNNEQHDKDSLNETGSTTGGTADNAPGGGGGTLNNNRTTNRGGGANGASDDPSDPPMPRSHSPPPKSLVSRILARSRTPDDLLDHSEPFSQLWIVLSNVYGMLVIVLTLALCLAEVMDTPVPLLSLQGIFLMYMYLGSIAVIIAIYMWVLIDSCSNMRSGGGLRDIERGVTTLSRFGSLKRAHISRSRTAATSFNIRIGALVFGLATLVFNGLEMAMHSMMQGAECLNDIIFVHPVVHGLFTFLQMHFLFVNSQVLVERFGSAARFGFTHLAATNIAVWARLVIWDSAQEWTYFVHIAQRGPLTDASPLNLRKFPESLTKPLRDINDDIPYEHNTVTRYEPISQEQISQVVAFQECLNTNSLGQLWTSSMPYLYPFIVQFSLIAAAVTFVMGQNVGRGSRLHKKFQSVKDLTCTSGHAGCDGASKGIFLGILCMVAGIVVILIFLVVRNDENFPLVTLTWVTCGTLIGILGLSCLMTFSGLIQIRSMSVVTRAPTTLDSLLSNVALFGVQLYSVFTIVVCACMFYTLQMEQSENEIEIKDIQDMQNRHLLLLITSGLQLLQCYAQSTFIAEASKRCCITRLQILAKPGRQVVTFLLCSNVALWAFDTVVTQNWISQELQLRFFGLLAWGVISRIGLPLLIFYRFHSFIMLLEVWKKCYRTLKSDHPLN